MMYCPLQERKFISCYLNYSILNNFKFFFYPTSYTSVDLEAGSGFDWVPFDKLELQFYNIRHLQHHTGQLCERLRTKQDIGIGWVFTSKGGETSNQP